jgi:hypothetical protein
MNTKLGDVIGKLQVSPERPDDDVVDNDLILVWGTQRRIITGADLLGRLLRGIAMRGEGGVTPESTDSRQTPAATVSVHPAA